MSQDIADMPGIEAAIERFDALTGNTSAAADPGSAGRTETKTEAIPDRREEAPGGGTGPTRADARPDAKAEAPPSAPRTGAAEGKHNSVTETKSDTRTAAAAGNEDAKSKIENSKAKDNPDGPLPNGRGSDGKTRFAKAQDRLEKTWEGVNKRKGELDAQAAALEQQRLTLERDKSQFEMIRQQADKSSPTPEQALQASQAKRRDADALRMQARRAQDAGKSDQASRLTKQADKAEAAADDMADYAEQLRKNPPVGTAQRTAQAEQARKTWMFEACKVFPDLQKEGSRLQQIVAQHLNALAKSDPQLLAQRSLIYHVGRLADAQLKLTDSQAVAARVPELEKETEKLRARVKELEAQTSPSADAGVARLGGAPKDDYDSLRRDAADLRGDTWLQ